MGRLTWVCSGWFPCLVAAIFLSQAAEAGGPGFRALLVWGTNQEKPAEAKFIELEPKAREKLLRQYKWKNYWVIKEVTTEIGKAKPPLVKLSDKCAITLKDLGNDVAEIRLYELKTGADPKLVETAQHSLGALKKGEYCGLAGWDKAVWDDAWFVLVTSAK